MASSNNALRVTELDFDSIKSNLKEFLRTRSGFTDFNYEGSNWSLLLDALAYNTHYMGYYVNAVANEMFLDTAQIRDSVLSHAKQMNYIPTSKRAATAYVTINVTPSLAESQSQSVLTLSKYTRMISDTDDGKALMFMVNETVSASKANGKFMFANVQIKQGDVITTQSFFDHSVNAARRFNIPSANCDTSTLTVIVQNSLTNTYTETYTQADDITEVTANSAVYYLEENPESNGSFSITFGDGYLGKQPSNGAIVIMTYVDTLGPLGESVDAFTMVDAIDGFDDNVSISVISSSAGGAEKESIESIKFRAPIAYTTQNRAVTSKDFETLLLKDYPNIQAISVWGGQDNDPPVYGKVFISMLPRDGYYITTEEKQRIISDIVSSRSIVTVTPEIVDPEILYLVLNVTVRYDAKMTSLDENQLKALVREEIISYKDSELIDFNDRFRSSVLLRRIDGIDPSITGSELNMYVQKRVKLVPETTATYTVNFGLPLKAGSIFDRIVTQPNIVIADLEGVERECKIEENANTLTGITSITVSSGGNGYTTNPTVSIEGDGVGATATATIVNGSVSAVTVTNAGTGYTQATVSFSGGAGSGAAAIARLEADRATLYAYYFGTAGRKVVLNENIGTIRYDLGTITMSLTPISVNDSDNYSENYVAINAIPETTIVKSSRNQIVSIDENDSTAIIINMIAEE